MMCVRSIAALEMLTDNLVRCISRDRHVKLPPINATNLDDSCPMEVCMQNLLCLSKCYLHCTAFEDVYRK